MGRKTGANSSVQVELGSTSYPMAALSTVTAPSADVGKVFPTLAEYISDLEGLSAVVILDGVVSGFNLTPGSVVNSVDYSEGVVKVKGQEVEVAAGSITGITRPTVSGQVLVTALTVNGTGTITATAGTAGETTSERGVAGGPPFLPVDQVLLGYITATYYLGSASGAKVLTTGEIDSYTKEYAAIPSSNIVFHDKDREVGVITFASALPLIHAASAAGPGTNRRNVYASYYEPQFEEIPDSKDFKFDEDVSTVKSKAYGDESEQTSMGTPSWSASFSAYYSTVDDILNMVKSSKRWIKHYPDADLTPHWAGMAVIKVGRSSPVEDNMTASVSLEGSGKLYPRS